MKTKSLQEQIDKFYEETGYQLEVKDGQLYYDGDIDLHGTKVTKLPDNLVVRGWLDLKDTKVTKLSESLAVGGNLYLGKTPITELPESLVVGGGLDLYSTNITKLPDSLIVGDYLDLEGTHITELPDNLTIGGFLDLRRTKITKLPDSLVVGGSLYLEGTKITELPDNLVVGENLDLEWTDITELPENLVVGGWLNLYGTKIAELPENLAVGGGIFDRTGIPIIPTLTQEAKEKLQKAYNPLQWNAGGKTYIKADGIFSVVDSHKGNVWRTHRIGKDETLYIVTDGEGHYAHGKTLKEAKADLIFKINDRDTSSYKNLSLDDEISFEEAIAMYRTITGACSAGTKDFIESRLPKPHKERYTIREVVDLTDGEYGSEKLKEFFK